jgi:hypothetical protein
VVVCCCAPLLYICVKKLKTEELDAFVANIIKVRLHGCT